VLDCAKISPYSFPMAQGDLTAVIRALLERRGWNQEDLANRLKTTQATVSRWLAGAEPRGDKRDAIRQLATEVGILEDGSTARNHIVPIMGRVGGGASIEPDFEQVPAEGVEQVELPYAISDDLIGFRVVGDSMAPTYEEDAIIVVDREQPYSLDYMVGMRAAVLAVAPDGERRRYLKSLRRGSKPDTYNLDSINDRSPTIRDVKIAWASPVRMIIPNIGLHIIRGRARTPRRRK
jgi:repressor LexA